MKRSPEELESFIHQTLRSLPDRPAPRSLEARVRAAIETRVTLPWWRQSFVHWPLAARGVFLLLSAGLVKVLLLALVWALAGFNAVDFTNAFSVQLTWLQAIDAALRGIGDFCVIVVRGIPSLWLYAALAGLAATYATLFGVGAAAYRTLFAESSR